MSETIKNVIIFVVVTLFLLGIVVGGLAVIPRYKVWSRELSGKAELKEAEWNKQIAIEEAKWNKQIAIEEAKAEKESASLKAEADVIRAKGLAEAQEIINTTLTIPYLQFRAIQAQEKMADSPNHTTIYIPSGENGIPRIKTID